MMRLKFFTVLLIALAAFGQDRSQDLTLELMAGSGPYHPGDTVAVGIRASIPKGYHLYSNPLGPGIGKPLNLFVDRVSPEWGAPWQIEWDDARKSVPKRFNPPIGSWVWAYENEAFFFVKGVLAFDEASYKASIDSAAAADNARRAAEARAARAAAKARKPVPKSAATDTQTADSVRAALNRAFYEITVDALICHTACVPVLKSVRFEPALSNDTTGAEHHAAAAAFPAESIWQRQFERSEPLEFKTGTLEPQPAAAGNAAPGLNLGLSGLPSALGSLSADPSTSEPVPPSSVGDGGPANWAYKPFEENRREHSLLSAIIFALIAGLAMNLTPCIFPVLSIRILSFAESARESRSRSVIRSAAFAGGIVAVFLLLAALAAFAGFSWGQQFQSPATMVGIIAVIFLFALGMFDFYTLTGPSLNNAGDKAGATLTGDFLKGAAATIMATPCAGPFLGALLAWALLQKPSVIFTLFAVMGVGMAAPYVLLSSSKKLMSLLPKPGRWIEDMKHAMGFLLLIFAVTQMKSLDPRLTLTAAGICLSILCAASVNKRFAPFGSPAKRRIAVLSIALAIITAGAALSVKYLRLDIPLFHDSRDTPAAGNQNGAAWQEFTPQALAAAHEEGRSAIVNFTAQWCSNCKINKAVAIDAAEARELYAGKNIALLTADITNHNEPAQDLLRHLGSRSVPFLAIFPSDSPKNPIIMRDILSKDRYLETLRGLP
ncbi:MAG: thioredoxin family protein [Chitinispirillia bacterium]|nr:thioredoxin family protein [Chitinispirillia bacterium]